MELHRLDGIEASGLDNIDILDVAHEAVEEGFSSSQVEALEALGYVHEPEIVYEIQDEEGNVVMYADAEENLYVVDGLGELGFLRKIGRGLKNAAKFVGKKVVKPVAKGVSNAAKFTGKKILKPALKTFNRFVNPATILLRNGFLLAMKVNLMKVAERLRFGYLSDAEARKRGVNMAGFAKLKKAVEKAEKIYELAGGKKSNLKKAILTGKGNKNKAVPLSGFALGNPADLDPTDEFTDPFEQFIVEADPDLVEAFMNEEIEVEGLGEPASGAAIAAASGAVATVSALLDKIGGVFDKAGKVKQQAQSLVSFSPTSAPSQPNISLPKTPNPVTPKPIAPRPIQRIPNALQRFTTRTSLNPTSALRPKSVQPEKASTQMPTSTVKVDIPMMAQRRPEQSPTNTDPNQPEKKSWLEENKTPLLVGVGALVAGGGIWYAIKKSGGKSKGSMDGIPSNKKRDTSGRLVTTNNPKNNKKGKKKSNQKLTTVALM